MAPAEPIRPDQNRRAASMIRSCSSSVSPWKSGSRRSLALTDSDGVAHVLHDDASAVPPSRGCPLDYSIADVITYFPKDREAAMIE